MRRIASVFLAFALLLTVSGCGGKKPVEDSTTTLMIYMIGSDLESKSGAATRDLQEMEESGVDLSRVNVLVYAGGSTVWYNENVDAARPTVLQLTENGFLPVSDAESGSMGEPGPLASFLNFAVQYYEADRYALVLWDHGSGPVIGYGQDMLFDKDTLTLQEMQMALSATPFAAEKKLEWVGFDACLMASAELSCVWADYAEYLVASQEVEPAFGWNYSFLADLSVLETEPLLGKITESYLETCTDYYERKSYDGRDTTLSAIKLSEAAALEEAVDGLFAAAAADLDTQYHLLTGKRVETRALGLASTGSEYDLIDLQDLAVQLADLYPEETGRLQAVLADMVIFNAANTEDCGGMSLYYPFYNKTYYEKDWSEIYRQLGLFPAYLDYLDTYETIWLESDLLETTGPAEQPTAEVPGVYTLELTPAQSESFAEARFYILEKKGYELYTPVYTGGEVLREGNTLTADFDGYVLYVKNNYDLSFVPVATAFGDVGGRTRYSVYAQLNNYRGLSAYMPEEYEFRVEEIRFDLAVDRDSRKIALSALVPYDADDEVLLTGKTEEPDLAEWTTYLFPSNKHRYLTRNENGVILPLQAWAAADLYSAKEMPIGDGLEFLYAPLAAGEYYLMFEITNTQGNGWCSELLPITVSETEAVQQQTETIPVHWADEETVTVLEENGVCVRLVQKEIYGQPGYALELENRRDYPVLLSTDTLVCNDNVYCADGYAGYIEAAPGETVTDSGMRFGTAEDLGKIGVVQSLQFGLKVRNAENRTTVIPQKTVQVSLTGTAAQDRTACAEETITGPYAGGLAEEQVLWDTAETRISLMGFGSAKVLDTMSAYLCIENKTEETLLAGPEGIAVNGTYLHVSTLVQEIPPGCRVYFLVSVLQDAAANAGVLSVDELELIFRFMQDNALVGGQAELLRCPVQLAQTGNGTDGFPAGEQILLDENGVRVELLGVTDAGEGKQNAWISVQNESGQDISLALCDATADSRAAVMGETFDWLYLDEAQLCSGQRCVSRIAFSSDQIRLEDLSFRFRVLDFHGDRLLFESDTPISIQNDSETA